MTECPLCMFPLVLDRTGGHLVRCLYEYADVYVGGQGFHSEQSIVDRRARDATRSLIPQPGYGDQRGCDHHYARCWQCDPEEYA